MSALIMDIKRINDNLLLCILKHEMHGERKTKVLIIKKVICMKTNKHGVSIPEVLIKKRHHRHFCPGKHERDFFYLPNDETRLKRDENRFGRDENHLLRGRAINTGEMETGSREMGTVSVEMNTKNGKIKKISGEMKPITSEIKKISLMFFSVRNTKISNSNIIMF
jgi:hypothetical protein